MQNRKNCMAIPKNSNGFPFAISVASVRVRAVVQRVTDELHLFSKRFLEPDDIRLCVLNRVKDVVRSIAKKEKTQFTARPLCNVPVFGLVPVAGRKPGRVDVEPIIGIGGELHLY